MTFKWILLALLIFPSSILFALDWHYIGVIGKGPSAVGVLKNESTLQKTFVRQGQTFDRGRFKVTNIARNKIVIRNKNKEIILRTQGASVQKRKASQYQNITKSSPFDQLAENKEAEEYFENLVDLGQELLDSGDMTKEQINSIIAEEMQQRDLLYEMERQWQSPK